MRMDRIRPASTISVSVRVMHLRGWIASGDIAIMLNAYIVVLQHKKHVTTWTEMLLVALLHTLGRTAPRRCTPGAAADEPHQSPRAWSDPRMSSRYSPITLSGFTPPL